MTVGAELTIQSCIIPQKRVHAHVNLIGRTARSLHNDRKHLLASNGKPVFFPVCLHNESYRNTICFKTMTNLIYYFHVEIHH